MDINALASEFGSAGVAPPASTDVDINSLAAEFGSDKKAKEIEKSHGITIRPVAPPISGDTAPLPQPETTQAGGANPRDSALSEGIKNYVPSVAGAIADNAVTGAKTFSSGLGDVVNQGEIGTGAKKMGVGALQALTSIPAGIASEGVGKPITELTGNPDIGDRAAFLAGSAIPVVPGLGLASKIRPSNAAFRDLVENITNNGANPENLVSVVKGMKANPRLGPADLNPAVLSASQKLFTLEGDTAKNYLQSTSANRMATTKDTVNTAFDNALGKSVNPAEKLDQLKAASRKVGKEQIEPFLAANPHTDITDLIKHIDSEIGYPAMKAIKAGKQPPLPLTPYQRELLDTRNKLRNPNWPDRDQMFAYTDQVHDVQSKLREKAQGLVKGSVGSETNLGKDLFTFREKLKGAVGPEYNKILKKYADEKQIDEAFHYGHDSILKNGKTLENDPSFFKKWLDDPKRKPDEIEAAKEGARRAINAEIKGTRSAATNPASKAVGIGQVDFNVERLQHLLGKEEANKLLTSLDHARLEANTHNKIFEGSQTAMRFAADSRRDLPKPTPPTSGLDRLGRLAAWVGPEAANIYGTGYAVPGLGLAASLAANTIPAAARIAKDKVKMALKQEANAQYAKMALPTQGPSREALIKGLEAAIPGPKPSLLRKAASLARLVGP